MRGSIDWGDVTFPVSATVNSNFDSDIVRLAYRWSMVHDDRAELGLLLGVFMGGLGLGSLLLPRLVSTRHHPLRVYAVLELGIAAIGVALLHRR